MIDDQAEEPTIDWLALANDAYHSSKPYLDAYLRPQWEKNLRQWQGKHRTDSKYQTDEYGKSKLFRPRTRAVVRKNEAAAAVAYMATEDIISIVAENEDSQIDRLTAEIATGLIKQRLNKKSKGRSIPWFHTLIGAYQTAQIYGEVASYQYWDKEKDKPCIELIPPENIRIDPGADWIDPINTSPYIIHLMPMYVQDVRNYSDWLPVDDKTMLAASNEYYDSTRLTREKTDTKSSNDAQTTDYNVVWVRRIIIKKDGQDWVFYTLGSETLLSEPVPLSEIYWHNERPYVIGSCIIEAFKPHPSGLPELTSDIQDEINDVCNQRMDNVKFALNKRYFAKRGTQVDLRSLTRNIPGSVTLMNDPATDVIVHSTPDITSSSFQEQDRLNLDFDDLAGSFSGSSVQANRKLNETVGGMNMLAQSSNQVAEYQLKTFNETWVEPVLTHLVKLELLYETDETILRLAASSSDEMKAIGATAVIPEMLSGNVSINANVGTGASNPQSQVERFFYGLQTLSALNPSMVQQLNTEEVVKEVFGKLGYKDGKRFFNFDSDLQIQQLTQQIQQLQQELINKRNPELDAAQIEKTKAETDLIRMNKVKVGNEAQFSAMQGGAQVVQMPGVAPIADAIMINSGYQQPNPAGQDPNFPQPQAQNLGIETQQNTSPLYPPVARTGQRGIETARVSDNI